MAAVARATQIAAEARRRRLAERLSPQISGRSSAQRVIAIVGHSGAGLNPRHIAATPEIAAPTHLRKGIAPRGAHPFSYAGEGQIISASDPVRHFMDQLYHYRFMFHNKI